MLQSVMKQQQQQMAAVVAAQQEERARVASAAKVPDERIAILEAELRVARQQLARQVTHHAYTPKPLTY